MGAHVILKVVAAGGLVIAYSTRKGLFSCVGAHVISEVELPAAPERAADPRACKGLFLVVNALMNRDVRALCGAEVATRIAAGVGLLSVVDAHMLDERTFSGAYVLAHSTAEFAGTLVALHVPRHVSLVVGTVVAHRARV